MIHALILAGGSGTRFWPASRQDQPKQFLDLGLGKPMIELTIARIRRLIKKENVAIAAHQKYQRKVKDYARQFGLKNTNLFFEPEARNTFAPIAVLSGLINSKDKEAVVVVLPADHYIRDEKKFIRILEKAIVEAKKGYIVTLGIKPTHPETGYGYIRVGRQRDGVFEVERFIEKPDAKKARKLIKEKKNFWNGGIFIFRADSFLEEVAKLMPGDSRLINNINTAGKAVKLWKQLTPLSIDYAIMEKTKKLLLVPCDCGWTDLGSWEAVMEFAKKDKDGNVIKGKCINVGSKNIMCWSGKKPVAVVGLKNVIIVDTKDALLVCDKNKAQDVKKVVQELKARKLYDLL